MLKATAIAAAAAAMLATTGVSAQVVQFGQGGPAVDFRSDRQRDRDYDRERDRRAYERERDRNLTTGSVRPGCRSVTVTETDEYGNRNTRRRTDC